MECDNCSKKNVTCNPDEDYCQGKKIEITAFFDIEMTTECPYCKQKIDLERDGHNDDGDYTQFFREWINNSDERLKKGSFTVDCHACEQEFTITRIQR